MATSLPRLPRGNFKYTYLSNALDLTPGEGGETQRVNKLGDRFQFETTIQVRGEAGIALVALLNANRGSKVRIPVEQTIVPGNPGTPLVGASSQGTALGLKGLTAEYELKGGQFITVVKAGKRYLHQVVLPVTASSGGTASVTVTPMLRVPLAINDVVEIAEPSIEGYLSGTATEWATDRLKSVSVTISVKEAE